MFPVGLFLSATAWAGALLPQQVREVREFRVFSEHEGKIREVLVPTNPPPETTAFTTVSRLTAYNPDRTASLFRGIRVEELVRRGGVDPAKATTITIVGTDNYAAQIAGKDMRDWHPMIAVERDGVRIPWARGGPQTVWPPNPKLPNHFLGEGEFWAYYVAAIFVGTLPPRLAIEAPGKTLELSLADEPGETRVEPLSYPPGMRRLPPKKGAVSVRVRNLAALLAAKGMAAPKLWAETWLGYRYPLGEGTSQYELVYGADGERLPPWLGGPIQLCRTGRRMQCVYYVKAIRLEGSR